jgi:hypothetical protein
MTEDEIDGLCDPRKGGIIKNFSNYVTEDNGAKITEFLENVEKIFLANKIFYANRRQVNSLLYACLSEKYGAALAIVNTGKANLDVADDDGNTPLMLCCKSADEMSAHVAERLLDKGCNAAYTNKAGDTALILCCEQVTDPSLKIASRLLDNNTPTENGEEQQFHLDSYGYSGLDILLDFSKRPDKKKETLANELYINLVVKYIKLYNERRPTDEVYNRNMETICNDKELRKALDRKLLVNLGIDLNKFCKTPVNTSSKNGVEEGILVEESKKMEHLPEASAVPSVFARPLEETPPENRFVFDDISYQRLPKRQFPGGSKKTKTKTKANTKRKRKNTKKSRK